MDAVCFLEKCRCIKLAFNYWGLTWRAVSLHFLKRSSEISKLNWVQKHYLITGYDSWFSPAVFTVFFRPFLSGPAIIQKFTHMFHKCLKTGPWKLSTDLCCCSVECTLDAELCGSERPAGDKLMSFRCNQAVLSSSRWQYLHISLWDDCEKQCN